MATVILVRHGRTTANATGVLAGRTPGVLLDETGEEQAASTGERLAVVPLAAIVSSPLDRCRQTTEEIRRRQAAPPEVTVDEAISECDYGDWQGRPLVDLAGEDLWKTVQQHPSAAALSGLLPGMAAAPSARRDRPSTLRPPPAVTRHGASRAGVPSIPLRDPVARPRTR